MTLRSLLSCLQDDPTITLAAHNLAPVIAVGEHSRAYVLAGLSETLSRSPVLVVVPTHGEAERLVHDLRAYLTIDEVELFPAWETLPFERVSPSVHTMGVRSRVLHRITSRDKTLRVVVAPIKALVQRLSDMDALPEAIEVRKGSDVGLDSFVERLVRLGYRREYQVEHRGEIAVRGSIVDIYPSTSDTPIRVDLWGDEVDRLSEFSPADQRSTNELGSVTIYAARELLPSPAVSARAEKLLEAEPWGRANWEKLANSLVFDGMESWLPWLVEADAVLPDLLSDDAQIVLVEPRRMRDRASEVLDEEAALAQAIAQTWGVKIGAGEGESVDERIPRLHVEFDRVLERTKAPTLSLVPVAENPDTPLFRSTGWGGGAGADGESLVQRLGKLSRTGVRIVVCADGAGSAARMSQSFADLGFAVPVVPELARVTHGAKQIDPVIVVQSIERGFVAHDINVAIVSESDVTGRRTSSRRAARVRTRAATESFFDDLKPGDYVVHHQHGVGKYVGMVKRSIGGVERDYLQLEYRGDDKLYIPSDQIDAIRPYSSGDAPTLHRLGGSDWRSTKARVRSAVTEIAQELVVLYQRRQVSEGFQFAQDTPWQHEMEEAFPFNETVDQLKAIEEVKADMERPMPMDRLVCGDVGFGKTEVAIRAAFKAIQDGKQVAVLVPTTLLARQHFLTFSERFAGFPVRVEMLSRFLTTAQAKKVIQGLADKSVDVVIGTHRLLAGNAKFGDLGLLIVDEEQRFGVDHKEAMKKLRTNVDVLTLSATPIPRTLEMSLTGIRDLTLLNTPPAERQPILTYVGEFDELAVAEAIRRELLREGQVFYVHNRVQTIDETARRIRELVPEARIAVAHGQMDESLLEKTVIDFWEGEYDVMVCTTIIESGIDMPTVNTLVVDRADRLGLGQLHQLRGRVGRSGQRAYAYLFYPRDQKLTEQAYERLRTIGEHTELGSGFKIAMRDLQIRGAGNLLGGTQSGHIDAVGYDLYVQMVTEAVAELKGEPIREPAEIKIELPLNANLPRTYVERDDIRLDAYRRLATIETASQVKDIEAEWVDRFGPIPPEANALLGVARLRAECVRTGVREVTISRDIARISPITLAASKEIRLKRMYPGSLYKSDAAQIQIKVAKTTQIADQLVQFLQEMLPEDVSALTSTL